MICPNGHQSTSTDYCDVCGVAMPAAAGGPAAPAVPAPPDSAAPSAATGVECPHCGAQNLPDALFCEACGYDFTTGTMPRPLTPPATGLDAVDAPAPVDAPTPVDAPAPVDPAAPLDAPSALDAPAPVDGPSALDTPAPVAATPLDAPAANTSTPLTGWVAEVWIDPDWYAHEGSTDALPSPGMPRVVTLAHTSILIGRASKSRGITPDIDLSSDNGISRRHAQLTTDGSRWWVEDLGSSNGTYVGNALGVMPTDPVPSGQRQEIRPDDRVYLGAWTRVIVRKAAPGEV